MAEPIAWMDGKGNLFKNPDDAERGQTMRPLYAEHPWIGLTLKDMPDKYMGNKTFIAGAKWAAKQLKANNVPKD